MTIAKFRKPRKFLRLISLSSFLGGGKRRRRALRGLRGEIEVLCCCVRMNRNINLPDNGGCYTLVIGLAKPKSIQVGKLGCAFFPAGVYFYTGSAMSGLRARIARHLRKSKKRRWHIDYLLGAPGACVNEVVARVSPIREECRHNQRVARLPGATIILPGFGSSDCTAGCASHLVYFGTEASGTIRRRRITRLAASPSAISPLPAPARPSAERPCSRSG